MAKSSRLADLHVTQRPKVKVKVTWSPDVFGRHDDPRLVAMVVRIPYKVLVKPFLALATKAHVY